MIPGTHELAARGQAADPRDADSHRAVSRRNRRRLHRLARHDRQRSRPRRPSGRSPRDTPATRSATTSATTNSSGSATSWRWSRSLVVNFRDGLLSPGRARRRAPCMPRSWSPTATPRPTPSCPANWPPGRGSAPQTAIRQPYGVKYIPNRQRDPGPSRATSSQDQYLAAL